MPKTGLTSKTKAGRAALSALANAAKASKVISPEVRAARSAAHSEQLRKRHANTSPEQKAATAEKRRRSLLAYWASRKGKPDPERSAKISAAQKKIHAGLTTKEREARRKVLIKANRLSNLKPHRKLSAKEMAVANEKRAKSWTQDARQAQAARSVQVANLRSPEDKAVITSKRLASYLGRSDADKAKTSKKIRLAYSRLTLDEKQALLAWRNATKRARGTFNTSQAEEDAYQLLCEYFEASRIHRNFRSPVYPYACDFVVNLAAEGRSHIKDALFIECNFHWTHGGAPFDPTALPHRQALRRWRTKAKTSPYFATGIGVWTERDVAKRALARKNNLSWFEFFNLDALADFLKRAHKRPKLAYTYTDNELAKAVDRVAHKSPRYVNEFTFNFMPHFYRKEFALWGDTITRFRLLANREKYLRKPAASLTDQEILAGFRKSGLTHREHFSHFPVCLVKQFVDLVGPRSVYDPFLGWGHRMVGFAALNVKYTGNDLWDKSYKGGRRIAAWLSANWTGASCSALQGDAAVVKPDGKHDAVFTCPPYPLAAEVYESSAGAEHLPLKDYWTWWAKVVKAGAAKNVRSIGLVVPSRWEKEYAEPILGKGFELVHRELVLPNGRAASHLSVKKNFEVFLIWRKQ